MDGRQRPIKFLEFDHTTNKFGVVAENLPIIEQLLGSLPAPIRVVSVVGRARSGKSLLMNCFYYFSPPNESSPYGIGPNEGFELGPEMAGKTRGVWLWVKTPLPDRSTGSGGSLVLLDTEGMRDPANRDPTYDAKVVCLSLALASSLVYNVSRVVDRTVLEDLFLNTELTSKFIARRDGQRQQVVDIANLFPKLHFLIRDDSLEYPVNPTTNAPVTRADYLEYWILRDVSDENVGVTDELLQQQQHKRLLRVYFRFRTLDSLPYPLKVVDDIKLQHMESTPESDIEPKFLNGMKGFVDHVLDNVEPKYFRSGVVEVIRSMSEISRGDVLRWSRNGQVELGTVHDILEAQNTLQVLTDSMHGVQELPWDPANMQFVKGNMGKTALLSSLSLNDNDFVYVEVDGRKAYGTVQTLLQGGYLLKVRVSPNDVLNVNLTKHKLMTVTFAMCAATPMNGQMFLEWTRATCDSINNGAIAIETAAQAT